MNKEQKDKAVVVVSGGADSITLLYWANQKYDVRAINFVYGSKHNDRETKFAEYHCKKLGIPFNRIELSFNDWGFKSSLLKNDDLIPLGHYSSDTMKSTVVCFRNAIMLSIATGIAESNGAEYVLLGSHKGDRAQYPDCSTEFTTAMSLAAQLGTYNHTKILSPFNDIMKWDIVKKGLEMKIEYDKTWSCYNGQERPCLKCGTCVERIESFYKNDTKDPLLTDKEWNEGKNNMLSILKEFDENHK